MSFAYSTNFKHVLYYYEFLASAKRFGKSGLLHQAMEHLVMASSYRRTDKVIKRIHQLQKLIDVSSDEELDAPQTAIDLNCVDVTSDRDCVSGTGHFSTNKDGPVCEDENENLPENAICLRSGVINCDIECFCITSGYNGTTDKDGPENDKANFMRLESATHDLDIKVCLVGFYKLVTKRYIFL